MRSRGVFAGPLAQVVIVAPAGREGDALTDALEAAGDRRDLVSVVTGGATRQASVAAGLAALWGDVEIVLVHDAARALTPAAVFERVVAAIDDGQRRRDPRAARHRHDQARRRTRDRRRRRPRRARRRADAAGLPPRRAGCRLRAPPTATTPTTRPWSAAAGHARRGRRRRPARVQDHDPRRPRARPLARGAASARRRRSAHLEQPAADPACRRRHRRARVRRRRATLWLAGLEWPGEPALSGHSDGDAVAHAIVDALLSAAGLGDIGTHFGTDHPEYAGAHADVVPRAHAAACSARRDGASATWRCRCRRTARGSRRAAPRRRRRSRRRSAARRCRSRRRRPTASGFTGRGRGRAAFAVALVVRRLTRVRACAS